MALGNIGTAATAIWQRFNKLPLPQKIFLVGSLLAIVGSVSYVIYRINRPEYTLLYGRIPEKDMASVVEYLKQQKVPYKIEADKIFVPKDRLYDIRLAMAKEGIPKGSGVGFEIFDEQKLGSTEFVQKVNYQRALQGELARTIAEMEKVEEARVHLVLPEESLFVEDEKPPSASIVLKLKPGVELSPREVQGIVHLVCGAVRGLSQENVTIVSTNGKVLFERDTIQASFELTDLQLKYKRKLEQELQRKVQSMLASVLGDEDVIVRVSADIDFNQVTVTENLYDPDSAVIRSQQRSIEKSKGLAGTPKGNPDVPINVESKLLVNQPPGKSAEAKEQSFERQEEITNYEMNRTARKVVYSPGTIKRLSVAVVVDGPYKEEVSKGVIKKIFVGRSEQELKVIEDVVKKAVGFNADRGDQVTVSNIPFASELVPKPAPPNRWIALLKEYQKTIINVLIAILVFFFVVRPLMKKIETIVTEKPPEEIPAEEIPALPEEEEIPKALTPRQQAIALVQEHPDRAAEIIKAWLNETT
ncbi:MAG: flagellar M-ring protein FliF [Deltaproteobacteria bacterium]|nr:flagellar M-ring protein FliF [Deltaproteobacteria bacterium]MBW2068627.1 flagellar M-ring protein FliF [Deltaproteobacteria bacterium]